MNASTSEFAISSTTGFSRFPQNLAGKHNEEFGDSFGPLASKVSTCLFRKPSPSELFKIQVTFRFIIFPGIWGPLGLWKTYWVPTTGPPRASLSHSAMPSACRGPSYSMGSPSPQVSLSKASKRSYTYLHIYIYVCVCLLNIYIYIYIYIYVHIIVHIYIYILQLGLIITNWDW